ncbi:MAG: hypothetical protein MUE68_11025 [Bacteroidetes bacterium]|jgi:hypothetical protein|nr:hypothetical protein [Bacteroidota bacterium]
MSDQGHTPQWRHDDPPVFGTWRRWYAVVVAELIVIMIAAYLLTEAYR